MAISDDPEAQKRATYRLGLMKLEKEGQLDGSLAFFKTVIELDPEFNR